MRPKAPAGSTALRGEALDGVEGWLADLRRQWSRRLDALQTELARGADRRSRRNHLTPPYRLQLTWQFGDAEPSLVSLELPPAGDDTEFVLRHTVPDDEHWAQYGAGAVGVGWDGALTGSPP